MKTVKRQTPNGVEYKRTSDAEANNLTRIGWQYCQKTEWKTNVRDFGKEEAKRIAEEKAAKKAEEKATKKAKKAESAK